MVGKSLVIEVLKFGGIFWGKRYIYWERRIGKRKEEVERRKGREVVVIESR